MKKALTCLCIVFCIFGCRKKEAELLGICATFSGFHREHWTCADSPDFYKISYVFFFDVDGDGVEEALCTVDGETWRNGGTWRVYYFENGKWQRPHVSHIISNADPSDFYYRVGAKKQPRLFVRETKGPATITRVNDERFLATTPIPQQEFDDLLKNGKLKRVTWYWCDHDNNLHVGEDPKDEGELIAVEPKEG